MKSLLALGVLATLALAPGCVYADIKTPLDRDVQQTDLGARVGTSSFQSVLGLVAWGDAGTQAAAEAGGITTIKHMDRHQLMILLGLYYRQTTIVYGD